MESLKKLCVMIVLATMGYLGYVTLMSPPPDDGSDAAGPAWPEAPVVEAPPGASDTAGAGSAPLPLPGAANDPWSDAVPMPTTSSSTTVIASGSLTPLPPSSTNTLTSPPSADSTGDRYPTAPAGGAVQPLPGESIGTSDPDSGPVALATGIDTSPPQIDAREEFMSDMAQAQQQLGQNRLADALLTLSTWHGNRKLPAADRQMVTGLLDQLAGTVIYSREPWLEKPYVVQPGDSLLTIAERYEVPAELLANINGLGKSPQVRPGDELKVMHGPFDALVDLEEMELTLLLGGRYAGRFPIGVGGEVPLAEGEYAVRNKATNPTYYGPGPVIDADDPSNPLGEYQLDLGNHVGIHGTNNAQSIGKVEGPGSIRLNERDIVDVFNILSVGSRVVVKR